MLGNNFPGTIYLFWPTAWARRSGLGPAGVTPAVRPVRRPALLLVARAGSMLVSVAWMPGSGSAITCRGAGREVLVEITSYYWAAAFDFALTAQRRSRHAARC